MTLLRHWAAVQPDKIAVRMADGEALSFAQLDGRADRVAHWLLALGLAPGASVALLLENQIRTFELWWGARRAGLYYVPISTQLTPREIAYLLRDSGATVLVTSAALGAVATSTLALLQDGELPHRFAIDGEVEGFRRYEPALEATPVAGELPQRPVGREFMYSSGTTGVPKGIRRALTPYEARHELPPLEQQLRRMFRLDAQTVYLSPSPLYHATGRFVVRTIECGGTAVILPRFDARQALAAIERHRVTHAHWVPTMFVRLLALDSAVRERFDLASQKVALHATSPCPPRVKRAMIDWWGPIVDEYYGGSENVGVTFIQAADWLAHPGSVGRPITGAVHIVAEDDHDRELPAGEIGMVYFSGGVGFTYHGDEGKTRSAYNAQGWGSYGDMGHVDADGFLFLSDRRSDLVITGGVNVYPQEVENVLLDHPAVADAAVIGVPHDEFGQQVRAVVQLARGRDATPDIAVELMAWCRERLSGIKCPRSVGFSNELPRSDNGKLLRRVIREQQAALIRS